MWPDQGTTQLSIETWPKCWRCRGCFLSQSKTSGDSPGPSAGSPRCQGIAGSFCPSTLQCLSCDFVFLLTTWPPPFWALYRILEVVGVWGKGKRSEGSMPAESPLQRPFWEAQPVPSACSLPARPWSHWPSRKARESEMLRLLSRGPGLQRCQGSVHKGDGGCSFCCICWTNEYMAGPSLFIHEMTHFQKKKKSHSNLNEINNMV